MRRLIFISLGLALLLAGAATALGIPQRLASTPGTGASPAGSLECSVKTVCNYATEVDVFHMSDTSNAHAGTPGGSAYAYRVCCTKLSGIGTQCTTTPHAVVLTLSGTDNAHVASDVGPGAKVCFSAEGDDAAVDCTYGATCPDDYACLATISGSTNAHVADCDGDDDYATKVCCQVTPDNCPTVSNPGQANTDGDEWGNACDNCPDVATPWWVPVGDDDCDGFTTADEEHVGTDPLDDCPETSMANDEDPDAWPLDMDDDQDADIYDVLKYVGVIGVMPPVYVQRLDLDASDAVDIYDVLKFVGIVAVPGKDTCTNP